LGVEVTVELRRITQKMTTNEVTRFWFERNPWEGKGIEEVEIMMIDRVIELIELENCLIPGVVDTIKELKLKEGGEVSVSNKFTL